MSGLLNDMQQNRNASIEHGDKPGVGQSKSGKISWADLTDSDFKAEKLNWADLSDELLTSSPFSSACVDTDTVTTETPSQSCACVEQESSDAERDEIARSSPSHDFATENMALDHGEYMPWPIDDWSEYAFQVASSGFEMSEASPSDLQFYQYTYVLDNESSAIGDYPQYTALQQAHCEAAIAAFAHQQALSQYNWSASWWDTEDASTCLAHQEAFSKALATARPHAKSKIQFQ